MLNNARRRALLVVKAPKDFKKLSLLIPKDLHTSLKKYALENDITVTHIMIKAITDLVNPNNPKHTEK